MKHVFALAIFLLALHPNFAFADDDSSNEVLGITEVDSGVLRSGRPDPSSMPALQRRGVRTIIDLEAKENVVSREERAAKAAGIKFINSPIPWGENPTDEQVSKILETLSDPDAQPVLIHCHEGRDRTGVLIALYRVRIDGWSPMKAQQEMYEMGFHRDVGGLDRFFMNQTNLH
jgi:tyrosine-protein phosphatase SIW14